MCNQRNGASNHAAVCWLGTRYIASVIATLPTSAIAACLPCEAGTRGLSITLTVTHPGADAIPAYPIRQPPSSGANEAERANRSETTLVEWPLHGAEVHAVILVRVAVRRHVGRARLP